MVEFKFVLFLSCSLGSLLGLSVFAI
jgi:hypothetical protein